MSVFGPGGVICVGLGVAAFVHPAISISDASARRPILIFIKLEDKSNFLMVIMVEVLIFSKKRATFFC